MNNLNADALIKAGREVFEPFRLLVTGEDGIQAELTVRKILRLLPGRRIVAVADLGQKRCLVKLFIGRMSWRYVQREIRGVRAIESAGVRTPQLQWQGTLSSGGGHLLAFEYLETARSLIDVWQDTDSHQARADLMARFIPVIAALHQAGVIQNDIHPENFLIQGEQIHTIDGGGIIHKSPRPLGVKRSIDNLGLFLAQFHASNDDLVPEMLSLYCAHRGWPMDRVRNLASTVRQKRNIRKADAIAKSFRECTRFACRKRFTRFEVIERKFDSAAMREFLDNLDAAMAGGAILKAGNTATVALVESPIGPVVVKRYNIKGILHLFSRLFRRSRAWHSWANAMRLEFLDIPTVTPVALVEERFGPLRRRAYFLSTYIEGPDATQLADMDDAEQGIQSVAALIKSLAAAGVSHGDLKASNFLLGEEGAVVIDLDSMTEHRPGKAHGAAQQQDLARFMKNWDAAPSLQRRFSELLGLTRSL